MNNTPTVRHAAFTSGPTEYADDDHRAQVTSLSPPMSLIPRSLPASASRAQLDAHERELRTMVAAYRRVESSLSERHRGALERSYVAMHEQIEHARSGHRSTSPLTVADARRRLNAALAR